MPQPDIHAIRSSVTELVKHQVYRGDYDRALPAPDASGFYHYRDKKLHVELSISPRDGWLSCSLNVYVIRRRWPLQKRELVLATGYGYDVSVFRPGMWCDYVSGLAEKVRPVATIAAAPEESAGQAASDLSFTPIDDSSIFRK
jgi:hypothetical protein